MKLSARFYFLLTAIITGPLFLSVLWIRNQYDPAVLAALIFVFSLSVAFMILYRVVLPINRMVDGVNRFLKGDYHLNEIIPRQGWSDAKVLIELLNRMMLELQAYRAFQLDQILEEKSKAQALIDAISDGVVLLDDRGGVIYSNQVALRLLGITGDYRLAVLPSAIRKDAFVRIFENIMLSADKRTRVELDVPFYAVAGAVPVVKRYKVISNRFALAALKRPGRVVVMRDVTAEKEVEKAKEDFFHMITHDMRAPLSTIQGYVEILMRKTPPSPGTDRYFKNTLYSARRLSGMVDDILNTTKLQRGTMTLEPRKISANELISRVVDNNEPMAAAKNIKINLVTDPDERELYADPALIERVVTNLVGNSIKFTPAAGTVTIGVSHEGKEVVFWVNDTGPGIPEEKREDIFDKYSQLDEHKAFGFGLGLAMCKMTVELHKGRIWVESEPGKGSKFIFTLPAASAENRTGSVPLPEPGSAV